MTDGDAEVRLHHFQLADLAVEYPLADVDHGGMDHGPHRLHQEPIVPGRRLDHLAGLGRVDGEGLLAQHVLAGVEGGDRHRMVVAVG